MRARIRALFDGAGWFVGPAIALLVFALLAVAVEAQSPDVVLWTGHRVVGTKEGGIVYYRWHGQNYSVDVPGYGSSKSVSVYLDPSDPSNAMTENAGNRALVVLLIGVPITGALVLLAIGPSRNYRRMRRELRGAAPPVGYGQGLDPEFIAKQLGNLRRDQNLQ